MKDHNAGKYNKHYKDEFKMAETILQPYAGSLTWSEIDYEAFRFVSPEVTLIFYPHMTSSLNYHLRVREQNSKNKELANKLMSLLHIGSGHWCTFTRKHHNYNQDFKVAKEHKLEFGWARDKS